MRKLIQKAIRGFHLKFCSGPLPDALGIYFHDLAADKLDGIRWCLDYFKSEGYRFVDPLEYSGGEGKRVYLSFDDNFVSWVENLGLFDEFGVRATFFVNTCVLRGESAMEETEAYFDRICSLLDRTPLARDEICEIRRRGHTIGNHTHSHYDLGSLSHENACEEIRLCREILEDILGEPVVHFSYPFGMPRNLTPALRDYCFAQGMQTISDATPGMLRLPSTRRHLRRTQWRAEFPSEFNLQSLRADGSLFTKLTGRSAVG